MRSVRLLKALDRDRRVTAVPFQKTGVPASVELTVKECVGHSTRWRSLPRRRGGERGGGRRPRHHTPAAPVLPARRSGDCRISSIPLSPPTAVDCPATDPTAPNTPLSVDNSTEVVIKNCEVVHSTGVLAHSPKCLESTASTYT
jgi:hypothetical protein